MTDKEIWEGLMNEAKYSLYHGRIYRVAECVREANSTLRGRLLGGMLPEEYAEAEIRTERILREAIDWECSNCGGNANSCNEESWKREDRYETISQLMDCAEDLMFSMRVGCKNRTPECLKRFG